MINVVHLEHLDWKSEIPTSSCSGTQHESVTLLFCEEKLKLGQQQNVMVLFE